MTRIAKFNGTTSYLECSPDVNTHGIWGTTTFLYDVDLIIYSGENDVVRLYGYNDSYNNYIIISDTDISIRYNALLTVIPLTTALPKDVLLNLRIRRSGDLHEVFVDSVANGTVSSANETSAHVFNNRLGFVGIPTATAAWGLARFRYYNNAEGTGAARVDWNAETSSLVASPFVLSDDSLNFSADAVGTDMVWDEIGGVSLPIADAGSDRAVVKDTVVTLDGSASIDTNSTGVLTYLWTQTSGTAVTLSDTTSVTPTFTPNTFDEYSFSLVVNDGSVSSSANTVVVGVPEFGGVSRFSGTRLGEVISTPASMPPSEEGIYYPCIIPTNDIPDASFPSKFTFVCYSSSAHSAGAGGIYLSLCEGADPTEPSNWVDYDTAVAAGDFDYLTSKPAGNPIYVDSVHGAQTETPYINNVGGVLFMTYHNDANISFVRNAQNTCLAKGTDGVNFTRFSVAGNTNGNLLTYDPATTLGNGHTGYFRWGLNPFSGVPYTYVGYSIIGGGTWSMSGMWGSDDAENWTLHKVYGKASGKAVESIPESYPTLGAADFEPKGVVDLGNGTYRAIASIRAVDADPQGLKASRLCEVLIDKDGHTILSEFNQFFKGVVGQFDEKDIRSYSTFEYSSKTYMAYTGATLVSTDIANNIGMLELVESEGFLRMLAPYKAESALVDFKTISTLPANVLFYNPNGDCSYSLTANGIEIVVAAGSNAGFYLNDVTDLSSCAIADLYLYGMRWAGFKNCRTSIGLYNDVGNLATHPKVSISNTSGASSIAKLYATDSLGVYRTVDTQTAIGYGDDYQARDWEAIIAPRDLGVRIVPPESKVYLLTGGKNEVEQVGGDFSSNTVVPIVRFTNDDASANTAIVSGFDFGNTESFFTLPVVVVDSIATLGSPTSGIPDGLYLVSILSDTRISTLITSEVVAFSGGIGAAVLSVPIGTQVYGLVRDNLDPSANCAPLKAITS